MSKLRRLNVMMDELTLDRLTNMAVGIQARGGSSLSRSQLLRGLVAATFEMRLQIRDVHNESDLAEGLAEFLRERTQPPRD
jgi:hypothetical protein